MEKITIYTTIENQIRPNGSKGLLYDHFENYDDAMAKFFTICSAAVLSGIPYHSAHVLRSDGVMIESRIWDRRTNQPESIMEE